LKFLRSNGFPGGGTSNPKPHWNHKFASVPPIPNFASKAPLDHAKFGIGTLESVRPLNLGYER
jgi:hypothetical protein